MTIRRYRITIPATTVAYEVDTERYCAFNDLPAPDDEALLAKLEDEIHAALELGRFGDADLGFTYLGGDDVELHGEITVERDPRDTAEAEDRTGWVMVQLDADGAVEVEPTFHIYGQRYVLVEVQGGRATYRPSS